MSRNGQDDRKPVLVGAEQVSEPDPLRLAHLAENRTLIVKRSLLATALGAFVPLPVMDEYVAGRVRSGLYMRLATSRNVDLPSSAADVLAEPREGSTARNATITAATLVALKLAWKKFFALLAVGRGAEEMATNFQFATVWDHYCARLHVGGGVSRAHADELRRAIHSSVDRVEKATLVAVFRDGSRILGRSALEAPRWMSQRLAAHAQRWVRTGGNPAAAPLEDLPVGEDTAWLDRAAHAVEERLATVGNDYLGILVDHFEERWRQRSDKAAGPGPGDQL